MIASANLQSRRQEGFSENPTDIEADQTLHKFDLRGQGVTDYRWLHANHIAIWGMRYNLVQIGDVLGVAHGRRRSRTDVPGPSVSYGRVDADVRPSDVYIPSPAHMSPPPYMASSSSMYHQLMPDLALQSSDIFNSPIPQAPYF
ncbi:hypothetical protein O6P43_033398 [Quillaja saponaria]|uniref:Uncharacterized protein n=1 Tax=Quillaja saponaria TaxID=32244 RepID=A0AAD7P6D4_QUISA|nr:hypothetical protein O6P43_033398 [Quillaja saponaria]